MCAFGRRRGRPTFCTNFLPLTPLPRPNIAIRFSFLLLLNIPLGNVYYVFPICRSGSEDDGNK